MPDPRDMQPLCESRGCMGDALAVAKAVLNVGDVRLDGEAFGPARDANLDGLLNAAAIASRWLRWPLIVTIHADGGFTVGSLTPRTPDAR